MGWGDGAFLTCDSGPSAEAVAAAAPPLAVGGIALRSVMTRLSESSMSEPLAAAAVGALELLFDRPPLAAVGAPAGDLTRRGFLSLVAVGARAAAPVEAAATATLGAEFCLAGAEGRGALRPVACWPECNLRRLTAAPPPPPDVEAGGVEACLPAVVAAADGVEAEAAVAVTGVTEGSFLAAPGPRLRALAPPRRALLPALPFELFELVREAGGAVGRPFGAFGAGVGCGPAEVEVEVGGAGVGAEGALAASDMAGTGR